MSEQNTMLRDLRRMIAETGEASVAFSINQDGSTELNMSTSANGISPKTKDMLIDFVNGVG